MWLSQNCHKSWSHNHMLQKDVEDSGTMILYYMSIAYSTYIL